MIKHATQSNLNEIIVVLGHKFDRLEKKIRQTGIRIIYNPEYQKGQSTSLKAGINQIHDSSKAVMFLLGDQPTIGISTINYLIDAYHASEANIVIPTFNKKRGNPVIIGRSIFSYIQSLSGDTGGRAIFEKFEDVTLKVPVKDHHIFLDIDTMDDYNGLIRVLCRGSFIIPE